MVIVGCIVLVLVGLLVIVRWGSLAVQPPPTPAQDGAVPADRPPVSLVVLRYLWYLTLALVALAALPGFTRAVIDILGRP